MTTAPPPTTAAPKVGVKASVTCPLSPTTPAGRAATVVPTVDIDPQTGAPAPADFKYCPGVPAFVTLLPVANGGTNSAAVPTAGGAVYGTGTAHAITAAGTSGQYLKSAGAGVPTWGSISTVGTTVAGLPAGVVGDRGHVTDALAPAFGSAVVGGGAVVIPVFRNATVWVVG